MRIGALQQLALVVVKVAVAGEKPLAHGALDGEGAHGNEAPGVPDEHRLDVFGPVEQKRVYRSGNEPNDIAVFTDQVEQRLKRVVVIGAERSQELQAAWSRRQRLRTDFRSSSAWRR
jgi:hypothetical protein